MTRQMADGEGQHAAEVIAAGTPLVAVYVTSKPPVLWLPADLALIPAGRIVVTIDQGAAGSPVPGAMVRDVETGAWTPANAVVHQPWTAPDPTIYAGQDNLKTVQAYGWRGATWLAWPGWTGTSPPTHMEDGTPITARVVAVQNETIGNTDRSVVFDASWPLGGTVTIPGKPGDWAGQPTIWSNPDGSLVAVGVSATDGYAYQMTAKPGGTWGQPVKIAA